MHTVYAELNIPRILATRVLSTFWNGVSWSAAGVLRATEEPDPPLLSPYHVRVRNRVASICGTDLHFVRAEGDPRLAIAALPGTDRMYLGHELCGVVVEVGEAVTTLREGERVALRYLFPSCTTQGIEPPCRFCAAGEYSLCERLPEDPDPVVIGGGLSDQLVAHEDQLFRVPDRLSDEEAALLEPVACGLHVVLRTRPTPGDQVLVLGCGSMGLMVIQAVRALAPETHVTALARYRHQADAARRLGAHDVHTGQDGYEVTAAATDARLFRGPMGTAMPLGGFDVVYDCVGKASTLSDALRWARARGRAVLVGNALKRLTLDLSPLWFQEVALSAPAGHGMEDWQGKRISTFALAGRLLAADELTAESLITHRFPLAQWQDALAAARDKGTHESIKVALTP